MRARVIPPEPTTLTIHSGWEHASMIGTAIGEDRFFAWKTDIRGTSAITCYEKAGFIKEGLHRDSRNNGN